MTDILVIDEWYHAASKNNPIPHVDSRQMAYVSMGILLFHRVVSSLAVLLTTERNYKRAFLQFCDLLIFEKIILVHLKVLNYE